MKYSDFNDNELLDHIYSCNEDANEIMLYKYRPLVINCANKMLKSCSNGADLNDLIQEGMIGLHEAINNYKDDRDANFGYYAKICINNKIYSFVKAINRNKNKLLNDSVPFENEQFNLDKFTADNNTDPSFLIDNIEWEKNVLNKLNLKLTVLERQVFSLKQDNLNYKEIAVILEEEPKKIDNALQRIKTKLKKIMKEF